MNKKNILYLLLLIPILAFSQKELSISFGVNSAKLVWNDLHESSWQNKSRIFFGVRNVYKNHPEFELSSELQYSQKGWSTEDATGESGTFSYLDAIHILVYKPIRYFGLYNGINTGYLLNRKKENGFHRFEIGWVAGVSFCIGKFTLFGHFNRGLISVFNLEYLDKINAKALNNNLQLGMKFTIFKKKNTKKDVITIVEDKLGVSSTDILNYKVA